MRNGKTKGDRAMLLSLEEKPPSTPFKPEKPDYDEDGSHLRACFSYKVVDRMRFIKSQNNKSGQLK